MAVAVDSYLSAISFMLVGIGVGFVALVVAASLVPKIANKLTPNMDEEKEILKGNVAMARYFGGIIQAIIIGMAIIIGAAVLAAGIPG